jgi:hypothetical protein
MIASVWSSAVKSINCSLAHHASCIMVATPVEINIFPSRAYQDSKEDMARNRSLQMFEMNEECDGSGIEASETDSESE